MSYFNARENRLAGGSGPWRYTDREIVFKRSWWGWEVDERHDS